jgi:pimeloyl-ACP methyl ester carboxylesterase
LRGEFLDLSDVRLYCYAAGTRGSGAPIVLLHGTGTSGHLWHEVVPRLPAGRRVLVLELLGHGRSDPPDGRPLAIAAHAARLREVLDLLGIPRAVVAGHELGALIALRAALEDPRIAAVAALALPDPDAPHGVARAGVRAAGLLGVTSPALLPATWRAVLARAGADREAAAHAADRFARPFGAAGGADALRAHLLARDPAEVTEVLADATRFDRPVVAMTGEADAWTPPALAAPYVAAIPGARWQVLGGAAHLLPLDRPAAVADLIAECPTP